MKAFLKDIQTGDFGEFYITGDMDKIEGNDITFKTDAEEVYPEMVAKCDVSTSVELTTSRDNVMFEDELLEKIITDIEAEAKVIKEASDNIGKEEEGNWSADHLFQIDSRVDLILMHVQKFRTILETIYGG